MSNVTGGDLNMKSLGGGQALQSSVGLGSINVSLGNNDGGNASFANQSSNQYMMPDKSANGSQLSMSNYAGGITQASQYHGNNEYMAMGPDKVGKMPGSAMAHRNGSRDPMNMSALSHHSEAAAKARGNSYTPLPDRGVLREQNQNKFGENY